MAKTILGRSEACKTDPRKRKRRERRAIMEEF
jgi:hypothetical protein